MNPRQLRYLTLIAIAVIAAAIWIGIARKPTVQTTDQNAKLYPSLTGQLGKVQAVKISKPVAQGSDQPGVELTRVPTGWSLKQRGGYPADTQKVNALLLALEDAKLREEKTSNPANYPTLGVQDLPTPGATGALVELAGPELTGSVKLIVGKSDPMTRSSYVRRFGEAKSWLTNELQVSTDATTWLRRDLLNIGADRIQEVSIQISSSARYNVVKEKRADANFDVTPLPKKRELNSVSAANSVAQTLTNLQLDDVRPLGELGNNKSVAQTSFHTFDGLSVNLSGYTLDDKHWITVKAGFDESLAKRFQLAAEAKDAKTTSEAANEKIRTEAETLNKQHGEWTYAIAPYKYDAIFKPVEELLKKP